MTTERSLTSVLVAAAAAAAAAAGAALRLEQRQGQEVLAMVVLPVLLPLPLLRLLPQQPKLNKPASRGRRTRKPGEECIDREANYLITDM